MASAEQPFRLGIDFGTSNTTAILRWPDGHCRPLLFDGSPLLPSAVYLQPDGALLVGRDALHAARLDPGRLEPSPKRRSGEDTVRLGELELDVTAAIAAVLARVRDEAVRVSAVQSDHVVLTHPADWAPARVARLTEAADRAGLPAPDLLPEPVAAAAYFMSVLGREIPDGSALVVYDFGGGTFDASVVAPAADGYRVLAVRGIEQLGGADIDAVLFEHVARQYRDRYPEAWRGIDDPQTPADRRHRRHLLEDVRAAKEMLSRADTASVPIPVLEQETTVTRAEFEDLVRPLLERTVQTTVDAISAAALPRDRITAVLLVGGSSRIPLAAQLLRAHGLEPSTMEQPETVVAEGSVRLASGATGMTRPGSPVAVPAGSPTPLPDPAGPPADPWESEQPTPVLGAPVAPRVAMGPSATLVQPAPVAGTPAAYPQAPVQLPPAPVPYPPAVTPYPPYPPPVPVRGRSYPGRRRRRWVPALLSVAVLAAGIAAAALARPDLVSRLIAGPTPTSSTPQPQPPYVREERPGWLPANMVQFVDDKTTPFIVPGPATNGGTCTYRSTGVVRVQRDEFDVSGCVVTESTRAHQVTDGAVEAHFDVSAGCAGMWMRTGTVGYFVGVCADGSIELHGLANLPPSDETRLRAWRGYDTTNVVVALLAQGNRLTLIADGTVIGTVSDDGIKRGRVGIGGFAPHPDDELDATITDFRAWWIPPGAVPAVGS